jgi:DNA-binding beta-propeller fold protein YncE
MTQQNRGRIGWSVLLGIVMVSGVQGRASASILFGTEFFGKQIVRIDTATNTVTTVANTPGNPDSMLFVGQNIVYNDESSFHALREIDLVTHTDTILSNQFSNPTDLTLTPDGKSVLVGDSSGKIIKYDFQNHTTSVFANPSGSPQGLAFDTTGRLFANLGNLFGGGPTGTFLAQLDPTTGAILHTSTGLNSLDGLTFDTTTGLLFATSRFGGGVYSIDPNNLSDVKTIVPAGTLVIPDGITSDGNGNLFIAVQGDSRVYRYDIASRTLTPETVVPGTLDDLAPASGPGSLVPEPPAITLLGSGALSVLAYALCRRRHGR